jgi:hypothetical protein
MDQTHVPRSASRATIGEALIVVTVIAGYFVGLMEDKVSFENVSFIWFLVTMVIFYMALLFCRMLFFWMTGGDQTQHPWWTHAEMAKKHHGK